MLYPVSLAAEAARNASALLELTEVVEELFVLARLGVAVAVPLVEATCSRIVSVNVDLKHLASSSSDNLLGGMEQRRPEALATLTRSDVQLVQKPDRTGVPNVGSERQQPNAAGGITDEDSRHLVPAEQMFKALSEHGHTR